MKKCNLLAVVLVLTLALLSASAAQGQTVLNAVGSSGVFATTGLAAITPDPITSAAALCGTNFWSGSSSRAAAHDGRNSGIPDEGGNIWVAWDSGTSPMKVCTYLSVDSVVGDRMFLEQTGSGNGTLVIQANAKFNVGANKVSFAADSCSVSNGTLSFAVDINQPSGNTATVTPHSGGSFSDYYSNGASVTITGSTVSGFNLIYDGGTAAGHAPTISGITQFDPTQFSIVTTATAPASDVTGGATATVTANCPGVPLAVFNLIAANPHFTMAFTDIRPEDAHFTFQRATTAITPNDPNTAFMGYSSNPAMPQGVKSAFSQAASFGLDFALPGGNDPITTVPVPAATIADIGAVPIMLIASNRDTTACGLGNAAFTNITLQALQAAFRGWTGATQDINPALIAPNPCPTPLNVIVREPFSGTYNTFEFQGVRSQSGGVGRWSQENGNVGYPQSNRNSTGTCPAWVSALPTATATNPTLPPFATQLTGTCGNPLNIQSANYSTDSAQAGPYAGFGGNRSRAIGTGEMVAVINSTNVTNTIGYAFYSLGTFGGKGNVKYVTVDGAEPLWPSHEGTSGSPNTPPSSTDGNPYGTGVFPTCTGKVNLGTFTCPSGQPTFTGVLNGSYPFWNIIRAVYYGPTSVCSAPFTAVSAGCLIQAAQDEANPTTGNVRDYVPFVFCANASCSSTTTGINFFRAHYLVSGVFGHNGNTPTPPCPSTPEAGGDMAGAKFSINYELKYINWIGCTAELTGYYQ
ncbi:MAG TPA: hypothetical protein VFN26_13810 [Candidatus Acidoferrum sp.]|nr:hypothetical protein [Candidatus Acidoferrum sp.]